MGKNTLVGQVVCDSAGRWDNGQASGIANDWVTWRTEYTPKKAGQNLRLVIANTHESINTGEFLDSCDVDYVVKVTNTVTGVQTAVTFDGSAQVTLASGEFWQSDPILATFGTQKLRIFIATRGRAGGTYYVQDNSIPGRAWQAGQVWDANQGTWNPNGATARVVSPYLLTGEVGVGLPSVALVGDSILTGGPEYAALSARSDMCVVSLAMAGESAGVFAGLTGGTKPALVRAAVAKFCSHRLLGHSTNDLRGNRTNASNSAAVSAILTMVNGVVAMVSTGIPAASRSYILTPPPYTGSTDAWSTLANQNGVAEAVGVDTIGKRNLLCDTMVAGVTSTFGTLDRGSYYQSQVAGNRGKFEPSTTTDGVHINQNSAPWIRWRDYISANAATLFPDIYLQVGSIAPTPSSLSLAPGYAQELAVLVGDLSNQPIYLADVVAVSSNTAVATVDSPTRTDINGLAYPVVKAMRTATAGQSATITVSVAGVQITVPVSVVSSMGGGAPDTTAPTVLVAEIGQAGNLIELFFSKPVSGTDGFTLNVAGQSRSCSWDLLDPQHLRGTISGAVVLSGVAALLDYAPGTVEDAAGNALEAFTSFSVSNYSTQVEAITTLARGRLRRRPHTFILDGQTYNGDCQPYTPKPDETPREEGRSVKGYWLIFAEDLTTNMVHDAAITSITVVKTGVVIETGPLYIRQIKPFFSGMTNDHVEMLAVAYQAES